MTHTLSNWRESWQRQHDQHAAAEAEGLRLGLPEPFVTNPAALHWVEFGSAHDGKSLTRFKEMVAVTAALLGPPDALKALETNGDRAPDLSAEWTLKHELDGPEKGKDLAVWVRVYYPTGCRVDPLHPGQARVFVPAVNAKLHPECRAVIEALEAEL